MDLDRRSFLVSSFAAMSLPAMGFAAVPEAEQRLVLVLLRGGADGLAMVPAVGDPDYASARGGVAVADPIAVDGMFGLHPGLAPVAGWLDSGELALVHAVAAPYSERSHFDAQNVLENGADGPGARRDGWLGRALPHVGAGTSAVAIGQGLPLVLRGGPSTASIEPLWQRNASDALMRELDTLYATDPVLGPALEDALAAEAFVQQAVGDLRGRGKPGDVAADAEAAGRLLGHPLGPRVGVMSLDGWDTHAGQQARFERQVSALAGGLVGLRQGLGAAWRDTVVVCVTEFGRNVAANGTGGTDHGVGGAALLAGGSVAGGRVIADWPGLARDELIEGRDLRPTVDVRAVFKGILRDHLGVSEGALSDEVFPGSGAVAPMSGLVRG